MGFGGRKGEIEGGKEFAILKSMARQSNGHYSYASFHESANRLDSIFRSISSSLTATTPCSRS